MENEREEDLSLYVNNEVLDEEERIKATDRSGFSAI